MLMIITTFSAAKDTAVDGSAFDGDSGIFAYDSIFATTIDITCDMCVVTADVDSRELRLRQLWPDGVYLSIQERFTAHAAAEDIATVLSTCSRDSSLTDGAASDVDCDVTMSVAVFIFHQLSIFVCIG